VASVAWADVVEAFNETDNIHWTSTVTLHDGTVREKEEIWLKNNFLLRTEARRGERRFHTIVDDGTDLLVLSEEDRTAQLKDSPAAYGESRTFGWIEMFGEGRTFRWIEIFRDREEDSGMNITLVPQDSNDTALVFEIGQGEGKAWIDAGTGLPLKVVLERT
jgi:hypothetical protein